MKYKYIILIGIVAGVLSRFIPQMITNQFEPYDSDLAFIINQCILSICAIYFGYKKGIVTLLIYLFSAYASFNAYTYIFGGTDARALIVLGLIITLTLFVFPLIFGLLAKGVNVLQKKYYK